MAGPKWRNFKLKNGGIVSVGYLPLGKGEFSWAAQYERPWKITYDFKKDISAGGSSLRKVMGELRLKIAADENQNVEKVTKKMEKSRRNFFLEGIKDRVIRNTGSSPVYISDSPNSDAKNSIRLNPGEVLEARAGLYVVSSGDESPRVDVLEIG